MLDPSGDTVIHFVLPGKGEYGFRKIPVTDEQRELYCADYCLSLCFDHEMKSKRFVKAVDFTKPPESVIWRKADWESRYVKYRLAMDCDDDVLCVTLHPSLWPLLKFRPFNFASGLPLGNK